MAKRIRKLDDWDKFSQAPTLEGFVFRIKAKQSAARFKKILMGKVRK